MLQGQTKQVVTQICAVVEGRFVSLKERQRADLDKQPLQQETELTLLDLEVFEETLAIEKIVTASTTRFWIDLESLMFRLGTLLDIPAEAIKLPVSPYILCSAYRQAMRDIEFPRNFLVDADSAFARKLLPELAGIYRSLNSYLSDAGLLPDIEEKLNQTGSQILIDRGGRYEESRQPKSTSSDSGIHANDRMSRQPVDTQRLLHETDWINALSVDLAATPEDMRPFLHRGASEAPAPDDQLQAAGGRDTFLPRKIAPPSRDEASRNRLLSSSEHLIERRPPPSLEMESELLRIVRVLEQARSKKIIGRLDYEELLALIGFDPQPVVAARLREAHKISAQLFDYLLQRLAPSEKQTLVFATLEICFLELALVDENFLIDGNHPGRVLIDRLTDLATLFPRGDKNHLADLVQVIAELPVSFNGASGTLAGAASTLSDMSLRLIKQQRQNKDRLISRENARDKIDSARLLLLETLNTTFENTAPQQGLINSIANVFVDRWVVSLLKGVPVSEIQSNIETLIDIANGAIDQHQSNAEFQALVNAVILPNELTKEDRQALDSLLATNSEAGNIPDNWGLEIDLTPLQLDTLLSNRPRLKRSAKTIQKLPVDTWFRYETQQDYRYLQIVWVNRHGTRFVLSDERGLKQRDLSIIQLALEFDRSLKRLTTVERLSLVEQTLFSKLSAIQDDVSRSFTRVREDSGSRLTHEFERALRRTKRTGETTYALGFTLPEDKSTHSLEKALSDTEGATGGVYRLNSSRACMVSALEPEMMRELVCKTYGTTENYEFLLKQLGFEEAADSSSLVAALTTNTPTLKQVDNQPTASSYAPFVFEQALDEAIDLMAPQAQAIRLRTIVRVPVASPENIETAFRLESPNYDQTHLDEETASRQRSLRIASNLTELNELCKLLRECEHHQRTRPHLILRLNVDTCLYAGAQSRILSLISEYAIGTSQLSFLIADSLQLRESNIFQKLTRSLRSIGCHIILDSYNPERVSENSTEQLNATEIVIDSKFWGRAAQSEPWKTLLPQLITDTHHILGQTVALRNPMITDNIEDTGIDYIERESDALLSTSELLRSLRSELL